MTFACRPSLLVTVFASSLVGFVACSSSDGTGDADSTSDAGALVPDGEAPFPGADSGTAGDDASPPSAKPTGSLEVVASGSTTMPVGTFTPAKGSAQLRAESGRLTVFVEDAEARRIELTIYDDAGTLDAGDTFAAAAPSTPLFGRVRVETSRGGVVWDTEGDGSVKIAAVSATEVTLTFVQLAQFRHAPDDVFTLGGTLVVPIVRLPKTTPAQASLAISNVLPEPISSDAANMVAQGGTFASTTGALDDVAQPFLGEQRAVAFRDESSGTTRNVHVRFPSGHLPRAGQTLDLAKFDRVSVAYFEGAALDEAGSAKLWEADQGALVVTSRTATELVVKLEHARMQSESPSAKGLFDFDGTITIPIPAE